MARRLRERLNKALGFEEVRFEIPHVFLPPRFRQISQNRNMLLTLDVDSVAHVRWEGALQETHYPLTPAQVRRLFRECARNMQEYRKDLTTFARFMDLEAVPPFWDPREDYFTPEPKKEGAPAEETPTTRAYPDALEQGGEPPVPLEFRW